MSTLPQHSTLITVPFHDIDVMEYAWHGHYFKYFEIARCALLETIQYDYPQMRESGFAWPVIDAQCRYIKPIQYGMSIRVEAGITEYENRLKIVFKIYNNKTEERLAKGYTTQVAVDMKRHEMCYVSPPVLLEKLGRS